MKIGLKFCGGCNPRYDRGKEITTLKEALPEVEWVADASEICDYWLISCGCSRECVNTDDFHARKAVIKLGHTMDYLKMAERLRAELSESVSGESQTIRKLFVGQNGVLQKEITDAYMNEFASMTGDFNRLHMDEEYAEHAFFGRRIAHGMIAVNLLTAVLGSVMPGDGGIMLDQRVQFKNPIYPGDTIRAEMTITGYTEHKKYYVVDFHGVCQNGAGEEAVVMDVRQMMNKKDYVFDTEREDV